jgi:hypothetical protein
MTLSIGALQRLIAALQLPSNTTEITINISADGIPEMTVRQLLTDEQINSLAEWYVTEGIDRIQYGDTTYTLWERGEVQP